MRRGHRRAVVTGVSATDDGAVDLCARGADAPVFGDAALVVFLLVVFIQPRHCQPVTFQVWLEIRQRRAHAGVGITAIAGAEHIDHPATRDIGRGIDPGVAVPVLGIGGMQAFEGLVIDVLGLAAPAVVDRPHAGIGEGIVGSLEVTRVGAGTEQEAVVLVGVGDVHIRVESNTVHADTVTGRAHGAGDMGAMGVVIAVEHTADTEWRAAGIDTVGDNRAESRGLGMVGVEA
ncbi:hypothetical protein D3C85_636400 [compost metagenome]